MNIISVTDITKTYTERKLFEKASFYLQEREKVGVIGINGTGKSTLLKIAAGIEEPDEGQVIRANHIVVRYLPQNPVFDPELSVIDTVLAQSSQNFVGGTKITQYGQDEQWAVRLFEGEQHKCKFRGQKNNQGANRNVLLH